MKADIIVMYLRRLFECEQNTECCDGDASMQIYIIVVFHCSSCCPWLYNGQNVKMKKSDVNLKLQRGLQLVSSVETTYL